MDGCVPRGSRGKERGHSYPFAQEGRGQDVPAPVRTFNPRYAEAEGALLGQWWRLPSSLAGNRDFPFISNTLN